MSKSNMVLFQVLIACGAAASAMAQQPKPSDGPDQPITQPKEKSDVQPVDPKAKPDGDPKKPERKVEWSFKFPNELGLSSGFDGKPGGVSVARNGAEFEVGIPVGPTGQLDLGLEYEHSRYRFSNSAALVPGIQSPFESINKETFKIGFGKQQTRQLGWSVGGSIGVSAEKGAEVGKSIVGGGYAGVGYYLSEQLRIGAAIGVFTRLEETPAILPLPSFNWEINDQWRLATAGKPGLTLSYKPTEDWTLRLGAWYESRNFRLDRNGPIPGGVGRDSSVPVHMGAIFKPTETISLDFGGGVRFLQNYRVDDRNGNTLADVDGDPVPYLSFQLGISF